MTTYRSRSKTQSWAGETIGILVLDCYYPFIPGNVANATTYGFPVRFAEVKGATADRLLYQADPALLDDFIEAARQLEREGVRAITGACGFMALFQREIQAAVNVPVFASSLMQIPFIHALTGKRVGVVTADATCLKPAHFEGTSVSGDIPVAIGGMEGVPAFVSGILDNIGELDDAAIRQGVVAVARKLQSQHDDLGAILLECSDLPPYAADIQAATGLPVFDFITMINYVHQTLTRKPFHGYV
ncbi:aspartate/glutamate racemase family protein [Roseibium sp. SCP14]|uniref:aspartate/glutamate racemase family protein n=1 Tax=Roseibium sp. SCP14 TaxID=3141375 RepID=UPI003339255B